MHEVLCNECGHVLARGSHNSNKYGPSRMGTIDVRLLLIKLEGECPSCKAPLTLKDFGYEVIRI